MSVSLAEYRLGGLRWIVLNGPDREAFGALGEHVREELAALAEAWPVLPRLRRHVSGPPGRDLLAAVRQATAESFPAEWAELAAFADGARVPFDDLALLNLRGDLGLVDGGIGCSDLGWRRERSVVAHNEDGAVEDVGRCALLTMTGTGRPPVTAFWYPGFVPANAFALTGDGLIWTVDHLPVAAPGRGAGRHFVGRGLQRTARTVDDAVGYLRSRPSAGGFSYTIGDRAGRVVSVEAAAGRHAVTEAGPGLVPLLWHTNHGRYLSGAEPEADGTSAARGETLDTLAIPAEDPGPSWFLDVLTSPPPGGVRSDPGPDGRGLTTLCTIVADLTAGQAVVAARSEPPVAISLADLAGGNPAPSPILKQPNGPGITNVGLMKALVYHGPGQKAWEDVPDASIREPTDVVVKVDTTTICGTDLHILHGDVAAVTDGRILGHEAVGTVTEVGDAIKGFSVGDRVLVPAITKCGRCEYCQRSMPSHCQTVGGIGWIFGHLIDGTQAESVRVPYADTSLYAVPANVTNEQAIFLADSLPTGYEVGVLAGKVRPGDTVAVVGAGAVGLSAILTTGLWGASRVIAVDTNKFRLDTARDFGATDTVEAGDNTTADVLALTGGVGVDVSIEAVGYPETLLTAVSLVRPGGTIANIGVHGVPVSLPMQDMWIQNVTLTMGLVDTVSIPTLLKMVASGRIPAEKMGTHSFTFAQMDEAYDVFKNAAENSALKVVITPA